MHLLLVGAHEAVANDAARKVLRLSLSYIGFVELAFQEMSWSRGGGGLSALQPASRTRTLAMVIHGNFAHFIVILNWSLSIRIGDRATKKFLHGITCQINSWLRELHVFKANRSESSSKELHASGKRNTDESCGAFALPAKTVEVVRSDPCATLTSAGSRLPSCLP